MLAGLHKKETTYLKRGSPVKPASFYQFFAL